MYPPRSERHKKKQGKRPPNEKKQKPARNRLWVSLNLSLITAIIFVGVYFYFSERPLQGSSGAPLHSRDEAGINKPQVTKPVQPGTVTDPDPSTDTADPDTAAREQGNETARVEPAPDRSENTEEMLTIHFGGDTIFYGKVEERLKKEGYDYPYEFVKDLFQKDDLTVLNLETPVTTRGTAAKDKTFVFKSPPKALPAMAKAGVDAVSLANNHSLDQGAEGLLDTIDHLKKNKVDSFGAGANSKDAYAPVYIERKGITVALCGFTRVIPEAGWTAGKKKAGVAAAYDPELAFESVQTARKHADIVIVVVHWGKERAKVLEEHQTALAHSFIDYGADLVIGGHPHVLQGLEKYKGKWIAYSAGNFIFTKSNDPETWKTAVFEAKCTRKGNCDLKLIPYVTDIGRPVPMNREDGLKLLREIQDLSDGVKIDNSGMVTTGKHSSTGKHPTTGELSK